MPATELIDAHTALRRSRSAGRERTAGLRRLYGPLSLLVAWFLLSWTESVSPQTLPPPLAVIQVGYELIRSGELFHHLGASLYRVGVGAALGVVFGMAFAILSASSSKAEDWIDPTMQLLKAIPVYALLPLFIIWLGIGEEPKILLISISVFLIIYINTYGGIKNIDSELIEAAEVFGASRWLLTFGVIIPGSMPGFLTGVRHAMASVWLALIFAEAVNARSGIGALMSTAQSAFRADIMMLVLILYAAIGLGSYALLKALEARILRWRGRV